VTNRPFPEGVGWYGLNQAAERPLNETGTKRGTRVTNFAGKPSFRGRPRVYTEDVASSILASPTKLFNNIVRSRRGGQVVRMNH
jgi:hypothetical protein